MTTIPENHRPSIALVGPGAIGTGAGRSGRDPEPVRPGVCCSEGNAGRGRGAVAFGVVQREDGGLRIAKRHRAEALFAPYLPGESVLPSVVWFPAQSEPDASVWLRGKARLSLPDVPASRVVLAALSDTRCSVDVSADFTSVAWRKLMQNAVAGLQVLSGRRAGMFSRNDVASLSLAYLRECLEVARAEGADLGDQVPREIVDQLQASPSDMGTSIRWFRFRPTRRYCTLGAAAPAHPRWPVPGRCAERARPLR
jgi:hypothetical protein